MHPKVVPGPYLADLRAQPDALAALRAGLGAGRLPGAAREGVRAGRFRRVVLTGMGTSLHALYPLHLRLSAAGFASAYVETAELLLGFAALRGADTLLIVVSQSGESAEIVELVREAAAFGHVLAVTNAATSTLARAAATVVPMQAGPESTVSCKTYVNTLAALHWLGALLTGGDTAAALVELGGLETALRGYLAGADDWVEALLPQVDDVECVFVTGRGASLATARTGGLILKESTCRPAEGMSCAAFRHGPLEMIGERVLVLVCEGEARGAAVPRRLVTDIVQAGGRAELIARAAAPGIFRLPQVPDPLLPAIEILPVQMLSLALAARDGREAGRFERATKVTTAA